MNPALEYNIAMSWQKQRNERRSPNRLFVNTFGSPAIMVINASLALFNYKASLEGKCRQFGSFHPINSDLYVTLWQPYRTTKQRKV